MSMSVVLLNQGQNNSVIGKRHYLYYLQIRNSGYMGGFFVGLLKTAASELSSCSKSM